jgi:hypothetical protein
MSFGVHGETDLPDSDGTSRAPGKTNLHRERRRMPIMHDMNGKEYPTGNAIYACATILVFGSQQGGGRAVLGGYNGNDRWTTSSATNNVSCTAWYLRGGSDYGAANPLLKSDTEKAAWIDGESVDPATTGLSRKRPPKGDKSGKKWIVEESILSPREIEEIDLRLAACASYMKNFESQKEVK